MCSMFNWFPSIKLFPAGGFPRGPCLPVWRKHESETQVFLIPYGR